MNKQQFEQNNDTVRSWDKQCRPHYKKRYAYSLPEDEREVFNQIYDAILSSSSDEQVKSRLTLQQRHFAAKCKYVLNTYGFQVPPKKPSKCWPRLGQFYHLGFMLPKAMANVELSSEVCKKLRDGIVNIIMNRYAAYPTTQPGKPPSSSSSSPSVGKKQMSTQQQLTASSSMTVSHHDKFITYELGYLLGPENQATTTEYSGAHFHLLLSRIRFHLEDKEKYAREFHSWPHKKKIKRFAHFFRGPHISIDEVELQAIDNIWKVCLADILGVTITPKDGYLVWLSEKRDYENSIKRRRKSTDRIEKSPQDSKDRYRMAFYFKNAGLKVFKDRTVRYYPDSGKVHLFTKKIKDSDNLGNIKGKSKPYIMDIVDFYKRYIFKVNEIPGNVYARPRGYLHGGSLFNKIIEWALKREGVLYKDDLPTESTVPFYDRPCEDIARDGNNCSFVK